MKPIDSTDGGANPSLEDRLYATSSYGEAVSIAAEARQRAVTDSQRAEVEVEFGWCLYDGFGRQQEALEACRAALRLLPAETKNAHELLLRGRGEFLLANCLWASDYHAAAEAADHALKRLREAASESGDAGIEASALRVKALVHAFLGQTKEEISSLEACLGLSLDDESRCETSLLYGWRLLETTDRQEEALQLARTGLNSLTPGTSGMRHLRLRGGFQYLLAHCLWAYDPAAAFDAARLGLEDFKAILSRNLDGHNARCALLGAAKSLILLDEDEEGLRCYEQLLALPLNDDDRGRTSIDYSSLLFRDLGRRKEAVERAKIGLAVIPEEDDSPEQQDLRGSAELTLAHCSRSVGKEQAAESARRGLRNFERVLARNPDGATAVAALEDMVWLNACLKQREEALTTAGRCLKLAPTDLQRGIQSVTFGQGLYDSLGARDEALKLARDGLRLLPEGVEAESVLLARATGCWVIAECLSTSAPDQAKEAARNGIASCEKILARGPLSPAGRRALLVAADLHLELEQEKQAATYLKRLMEIEPSPGQRLYLTYKLGKALRMAEDWNEGLRVLQQGLQQIDADKTQLPFIQYEIGVIERQIERFANAKESLRGAAEALKCDAMWGGDDSSAKEWEGAIQLELGDACYELEQYEEALTAYRQAAQALVASDERHWEALLWRGHCHYELEAYDQAQLCYKEVLANKIAGSKNLAAADEGIRNCHWAVAEARRKAGRLREAAAEYEVLASLYPDSELRCRALLWLAHCQALLWRRMDTRRTYEKILASKEAAPDQRKDAQDALAHTGPIAWLLRWLMQ